MKYVVLSLYTLISLFVGPLMAYDDTPRGIAHLLNRITFGPKPLATHEVESIGVEKFIALQLEPESIPLPPSLQASDTRLKRAIESPQQLYEVMVNFWFHHFDITAHQDLDKKWAAAFENEAIRPHAMGNFRDLLLATAQHPAMLYSHSNWQNKSRQGLNEKYAQELMEVHTLGPTAGYNQDDVNALTKVLSGWRFTFGETPTNSHFFFDQNAHDRSTKHFLNYVIKDNGIEEGKEALEILASHPATAHHISQKLAMYFIGDDPPSELIKTLAQCFQDTHGDVRAVLQSLFESSYFWDNNIYGQKIKTPFEYIVSAVRATGIPVQNTQPLLNVLTQLNGDPNGQELLNRLAFASALASGKLPLLGTSEKTMPVSPSALEITLNGIFSPETIEVVDAAPENIRAGLFLGSPDFMRR